MMILAVLDGGRQRFNAIRRRLEGVTQNALLHACDDWSPTRWSKAGALATISRRDGFDHKTRAAARRGKRLLCRPPTGGDQA
jgi:hypothetical protein